MEPAEFKTSRKAHVGTGVMLLLLAVACFSIPLWFTEDRFLHTHVRRAGGLMRMIEQTIGGSLFSVLMVAFGLWALVYGIVNLWKAGSPTPDVTAHADDLTFHPAVRREPASYDDISRWNVETVSGHPVLWLHLNEPYWSLQGLFKRKTVKLEGTREQLEPLIQFFVDHPAMRQKFTG